jgi:hypothetical protein
MMRALLSCALLCLFAAATAAQQKTVPRYFEFRDGSVLRLEVVDRPITLTVIRDNGHIEPLTTPLSRFRSLFLTPEQDFTKKKAILAAVRQLSADDFGRRERAFAFLRKLGPGARADLEACLTLTHEVETQARLRALLAALPEGPARKGAAAAAFDRVLLDKQFWGYLGNQGIPVLAAGKTYHLDRKAVRAMTTAPPRFPSLDPTISKGFTRISEKDFPPGCIEEPFERTPQGRPLRVGENIEKLFISKGFVLSTSIASSYVSVNNYEVQGKSRGLSAATHHPLWEGEITITFVEPGHEDVPAGVSHFGCYIAAVVPGGTTLAAFDIQGRELGRIDTQQHNTDFLGVRSATPIHRIRIIPHVEIDRDYTLDDFIFMPIRPSDYAHPSKFAVLTSSGERILCKDVTLGRGKARLHGLPGGLPDRVCTLAEVRRINAPRPSPPPGQTVPSGVFAELRDGSVLFGAPAPGRPALPVFARRPTLLKERDKLAGLWAAGYPRMAHAPRDKAVIWREEEGRWQEISGVRLLEEVVLWKGSGEQFESRGYRKLPPLWLAQPVAGPTPGSWHLRTIHGEDLVLTAPETMAGTLSKGLTATWQGRPLTVPAAEVAAVYRVEKMTR